MLIDAGCTVDGYTSDITRTTVFGKPTQRQRDVWDIEKRAQSAAFAAAQVGATCESVDAAARKVITDAGFGPDYKVPGLPHRTGHGIGLDGHEWTNFVRGNTTKIQPGMCFSDEPTIVIYGEFGIRLEDCLHITENGPQDLHAAESVDRAAGVAPHAGYGANRDASAWRTSNRFGARSRASRSTASAGRSVRSARRSTTPVPAFGLGDARARLIVPSPAL